MSEISLILVLQNKNNLRGGKERIFDDMNNGFGWNRLPKSFMAQNIVFILWGSYAQKKGAFIDRNKHLVLASAHPSPLSAYNGFFGNKHFSRTNEYLQAHGQTPIEW